MTIYQNQTNWSRTILKLNKGQDVVRGFLMENVIENLSFWG